MRHTSSMIGNLSSWGSVLFLVLMMAAAYGCARSQTDQPKSFGDAWLERDSATTNIDDQASTKSAKSPRTSPRTTVGSDGVSEIPLAFGSTGVGVEREPIATVDGRPIHRRRVVDLLLRAHGVGVLEQLVVLETAERLAWSLGFDVSQSDVDEEYDRALRRLVDPVSANPGGAFDRAEAARLLDAILSDRNISMEEYRLVIRRNSYLRKLVHADVVITDEDLAEEMSRTYGKRIVVRHIQLASSGAAARVRARLAAGEGFEALSRTESVNTTTAALGGLLEPFSAAHAEVPRALRDAAFALVPGEVSPPIRVGQWYHILTLERSIDPVAVDLDDVREELVASLRDRRAEPAMRTLFEKLLEEAKIEIHDPVLREAFQEKHPNRRQ
ncbi:MAG: peptidyl-prolyl cis-trans isomerase [Planctomycetes bacterium]|nr:peptidyl-prolyl cis-trans isomerase [Planctomycetota bacterium]